MSELAGVVLAIFRDNMARLGLGEPVLFLILLMNLVLN